MALHPVILCGGSGTRLWPVSRSMYPKQFIRIDGPASSSFLQSAIRRLPPSAGFEPPTLVCNNDHRFLVADEVLSVGAVARQILLEPMARNTAAAIAAAAHSCLACDADAVLIVMPSDHVIHDEAAFITAARQAAEVARTGALVLFGIAPDSPHTGYGYIRRGRSLGEAASGVFQVEAFVEKPDEAKARAYLEDGNYFWNSGIFVLHAQTYLAELERFEPKIAKAVAAAFARAENDLDFVRLDKEAFQQSPSISVDYAVMERTKSAAMLPIDVGWSDVGSWSSLWELGKRDANGNVSVGATIMEDTRNSYVHSERAMVTTLGVENLVIVETPDAILVADKSRAQDVGMVVARLKDSNRTEHAQHIRNHRPWGYFETLNVGPRFQVKRLHVKPGGKLSLQMHHHRSEHWIVVHGTAKVTIGDSEKLVRENESVYIFATQWHRLENPGKVPLEIIEIQIGTYVGEDDIVRSDDIYRRAADETK